MSKITYYMASSLDGYFMGPHGDMHSFVGKGSGLEQYLHDQKDFPTVIMGRKSYEFGYKYGVVSGGIETASTLHHGTPEQIKD